MKVFIITAMILTAGMSYGQSSAPSQNSLQNFPHGSEGVGGGGGVIHGNKTYVVDLVEAGVEDHPFFDPAVKANPDFSNKIASALKNVPNAPVDLLSQKLNEIYTYCDHATPYAILQMLELYSWQMVDFSLIHIPDENPVVDVPAKDQIQLAARTHQTVKIDSQRWNALDAENKAALILHEAIYALSSNHSSDSARAIVGYLLSPDIKDKGELGFQNIVNKTLFVAGTKTSVFVCDPNNNNSSDCRNGGITGVLIHPNAEGIASDTPGDISTFHIAPGSDTYTPTTKSAAEAYCDVQIGRDSNLEDGLLVQAGYFADGFTLVFDRSGAFLEQQRPPRYSDPSYYGFYIILDKGVWVERKEAVCDKTATDALNNVIAHIHKIYK